MNKRHPVRFGLAILWMLLSVLSYMACMDSYRAAQWSTVSFMASSGLFFSILGVFTGRGWFAQHKGGWYTYAGLFFAWSASATGGELIGMHISGDLPAAGEALSFVIWLSLAALLLAMGFRRHRSSAPATRDA